MCGIIGFAALHPKDTLHARVEYMAQGLYVNALRGQHSTGFFKVNHESGKAVYVKDAVDARLFLQQQNLLRHLEDVRSDSCFVVGHNRHATLGGRGLDNAHPFASGSICLVHNGTLRAYHTMPKHDQGDSDSSRVCEALSKDKPGGIKTLSDLQGDYAFVWHDSRTRNLYFATNGRRPLSYLRSSSHVFFASEGMMAKFLLSRIHPEEKLPRIQHFKPLHLYELSPGSLNFKTTEYHETPTPVHRSNNTGWVRGRAATASDGYEDYYDHNGIHGAMNPLADVVSRTIASQKKEKANPQTERFSDESKRAAKKRVKNTNALLGRCGLPYRVGAEVEVTNDAMEFYDSKSANEEEPLGTVAGYVEHYDSAFPTPLLFEAVVHQAIMSDVWHEEVDTIRAIVASAHLDEKTKDLVVLCIYKEVGHFRRPISESFKKNKLLWPTAVEKILKGHRWMYTDDDLPRWEWFTSSVQITDREMDVLLANKKCVMCADTLDCVKRENVIFVDDYEWVCRSCNIDKAAEKQRADTRSLTDPDKVVKQLTLVPTEPAADESGVRGNTVLTLDRTPGGIKSAIGKRKVRVDHEGRMWDCATGDAIHQPGRSFPVKDKAGSED